MGRVLAIACVMSCLAACADDTKLTAEDRALLAGYALPAHPPPDPSNQLADDPRAAALGHRAFFDARLSGLLEAPNDGTSDGSLGAAGQSGKIACADCHALASGGADTRSAAQVSLGATFTEHNAPTVIDVALIDVAQGGWTGWDGRRDSVWALALFALEGRAMNSSRLAVAHAMFGDATYKQSYEQVFGPLPNLADTVRFPPTGKPGDPTYDGMTAADRDAIDRVFANVGKALEAYLRQLVSTSFQPSPLDRMLAGDASAMTPGALRGAKLFVGKAACNECHRGPAFTDLGFDNIGVPQVGDHVAPTDDGRPTGIALVLADPFNRAGAYSDQIDSSHLAGLTPTAGGFRTAPLRNVAKTAPYMHDGAFASLDEVIAHYNVGGAASGYVGTQDVQIQPLLLDDQEASDLVEFLGSLSDGDALDPALVACPPPCP